MSGEQMFGGPETTGNAQPILIVDANAGDLGDRLYLSDLSGFASDGVVITRDGVRVGTVDPMENGQDGAALKIFLDPGADREAIDALSSALRFETIADDPASGAIAATVRIVRCCRSRDWNRSWAGQVETQPSPHELHALITPT